MHEREYSQVLLQPDDCVVTIIDMQPQMFFGVEGKSRQQIENSVLALVEAANVFNIPVIYTTVAAKDFSGNIISKLQEILPKLTPIDRTSLNSWEDQNFRKAVESTGRKKLIISGLWTEVCVVFPALCAHHDSYDVYVVADACGGSTKEVHKTAIQRLSKAGVNLVTWQALMLEWQRDWANKDTYEAVMQVVQKYGGAYGLGVEYANTMVTPKKSKFIFNS